MHCTRRDTATRWNTADAQVSGYVTGRDQPRLCRRHHVDFGHNDSDLCSPGN
ncbi:hypothetical protein [Frankia sp. CcWB3]